jgi:hypothetical protein
MELTKPSEPLNPFAGSLPRAPAALNTRERPVADAAARTGHAGVLDLDVHLGANQNHQSRDVEPEQQNQK